MRGGNSVRAECIFTEKHYFQGETLFPETEKIYFTYHRASHVLAGTYVGLKKGKLLTKNSSWKNDKLGTARK